MKLRPKINTWRNKVLELGKTVCKVKREEKEPNNWAWKCPVWRGRETINRDRKKKREEENWEAGYWNQGRKSRRQEWGIVPNAAYESSKDWIKYDKDWEPTIKFHNVRVIKWPW